MNTRPHPSCRLGKTPAGFSLVELVVTVFLLLALAALAWQGLKAARSRAHLTVSTTQLRSLAAANLLFAAENHHYAPATDPQNRKRWHGARTKAGEPFDPTQGWLAEYLGHSRRVGICPEFLRHLSGPQSWEDGSGGFGYNAAYIGGTPANPFQPNRPAAIADPARVLMFASTAFAVAEGLQEYPFADPPFAVDALGRPRQALQPSVHFRFAGRALVAWCDGHVSTEIPNPEAPSTNFSGGNNRAALISHCGPLENNGWWNPSHPPRTQD